MIINIVMIIIVFVTIVFWIMNILLAVIIIYKLCEIELFYCIINFYNDISN